VDGHGSHLTNDFIDYCKDHRILIAVFPPHATQALQPLDVVMFKPLSTAYTTNLSTYLHYSQGLVPIKKGDSFPLFWDSWITSFRKDLVLKAFSATGIWPMDPEVILKRFTPEVPKDPGEGATPSCSTWQRMERLIRSAVKDSTAQESKDLALALHRLQVKCELLSIENEGLRDAFTIKRKAKHKHKPFDLQLRQEYHGGAVFWSPRKIREARAREVVRRREEHKLQLQKADSKRLKEAAKLYKAKIKEEQRVARERAKKEREKERAEKKAKRKRLEQQRNTAKALQLSQRSERKASQAPLSNNKRQKRSGSSAAAAAPVEAPSAIPPPKTLRGRSMRLPSKSR
jgi:hypothetical protein